MSETFSLLSNTGTSQTLSYEILRPTDKYHVRNQTNLYIGVNDRL